MECRPDVIWSVGLTSHNMPKYGVYMLGGIDSELNLMFIWNMFTKVKNNNVHNYTNQKTL